MQKQSSDSFRKFAVVASSCVIGFVFYGIARLAGQLFIACGERFNTGRKEASLPFVLCYTIRNISGPIIGYLGNKFGFQLITSLGCLLAAIAVGACFLVEDIVSFTVLWGGCFGITFGMGSCLIVNILHLHFDKSFNKIHGIYQAGGCMGSLVLPAICEFLLENYGVSGTLLILSGFILNCVPASMLLRDTQTVRTRKLKDFTAEKAEKVAIYYIKPLEVQPCIILTSPDTNIGNTNCAKESTLPPKVTLFKSTIAHPSANHNPEILQKTLESYGDVPKTKNSSDVSCNKNPCHSITKVYEQFISCSQNFKVLLDPTYILILISIGIPGVVVTTLYTVIVDACRDKGLEEDVAVLMTFAVTDMLGRFFLAYAVDAGYMSQVNLYILSCVCFGLLLMGLVWLKAIYIVLLNIAAIGFIAGGVIVIPVGIIKEFIENENINMAFSSRFIVFAMLSFGQSPVIGYFRETLRSYDGLFYLIGSMCLLGAVTASLIPFAAKYRDNKKGKLSCAK